MQESSNVMKIRQFSKKRHNELKELASHYIDASKLEEFMEQVRETMHFDLNTTYYTQSQLERTRKYREKKSGKNENT